MLSPASVLVTGANRGIGLEFIKQFVGLNPSPTYVFAACRAPEAAKDLQALAAEHSSITVVKIDLKDLSTLPGAVATVQEKVGDQGLNLLINNAAILISQKVDDVTPEAMMESFQVNTVGPLMVTKAFLPLLRQAAKSSPIQTLSINRSAVINMTTGVASITENDTGRLYPYRTSKAALNMVTKNLSVDLKTDGILATTVHPGWVKTEMGGSNAQITTDTSVTALFEVLAKLQGDEYTGKFYHWSGREMLY